MRLTNPVRRPLLHGLFSKAGPVFSRTRIGRAQSASVRSAPSSGRLRSRSGSCCANPRVSRPVDRTVRVAEKRLRKQAVVIGIRPAQRSVEVSQPRSQDPLSVPCKNRTDENRPGSSSPPSEDRAGKNRTAGEIQPERERLKDAQPCCF